MNRIQIFGDSHSRYFEITPKLQFHAPWVRGLDVEVNNMPASTIIGLGKKRSKLNVAQKINEKVEPDSLLVMAFGQVDMELGYYYKKIVKSETITLHDFADSLLDIYEDYIKSVIVRNNCIAVKGLNLTVLKYQPFAIQYTQRIISENITDKDEARKLGIKLQEQMESFSERNGATVYFNKQLRALCKKNGWLYFDVNDFLSGFALGKGILDTYIPSVFDHHLIDSLEVRQAHLNELRKLT